MKLHGLTSVVSSNSSASEIRRSITLRLSFDKLRIRSGYPQYRIHPRVYTRGFLRRRIKELEKTVNDSSLYLSVGSLTLDEAVSQMADFLTAGNTSFNIDLTSEKITLRFTYLLFQIIKEDPGKTFLFTFVFNNRPSTPYFPSAAYEKNGYAIGLQPTNLSYDCRTLEEWLDKMKAAWSEIYDLFYKDPEFLGIDSSIAPILEVKGSLVKFVNRLGYSFSSSVTTDIYLKITNFLKENNPKPTGLCGLMFPCLEDSALAREYEKGNFSIERNIYLSLHSGLGIDTYPVGTDEDQNRVLDILRLVQGLSNKYRKPLSVRFVSDGKAKIREKTNFQNEFLQDVVIRPV